MNDSICISITSWAEAVRRKRWMGAESQSAVNTLQRLFLGEEEPDSAAKTIATIYNPLLQQGSQSVFELWDMMCDAVGVLDCHLVVDERLVSVINAISELPDVTDQSGTAVKPGGSWSGLECSGGTCQSWRLNIGRLLMVWLWYKQACTIVATSH